MRLPCFPSPERDARRFDHSGSRQQRCGSGGGGIKAASKPLSKLFQISGCFRQSFPTKALAVLWDFKGLQGSQAKKYRLPNFSSPPAPFAHIPNAPTPHSAARRGYRFRTANRDFQILVLRTAPPDLDPGKLEVFKKHPSTNCVFPKQRTLARLASKIEHRVVVGPDPLIVGSSAAGHHDILDAAYPSRQAAQGLRRLEAGPERGRQGVLSARGRRAATREAFVTAFAILQ